MAQYAVINRDRISQKTPSSQIVITLPYMIYKQAVIAKDIGRAAAGGVIAVVLANIVAYFLMRSMGKNLDA